MSKKRADGLTILGSVLVGLGVGVWVVFALLRWGLGRQVELGQFLPYHLTGVVPGAILKHRRLLWRYLRGDPG